MEPTNNAAERGLRKAVLWTKGSFGSASLRGAAHEQAPAHRERDVPPADRSLLAYLTDALTALRSGLPVPKILLQHAHLKLIPKRSSVAPTHPTRALQYVTSQAHLRATRVKRDGGAR